MYSSLTIDSLYTAQNHKPHLSPTITTSFTSNTKRNELLTPREDLISKINKLDAFLGITIKAEKDITDGIKVSYFLENDRKDYFIPPSFIKKIYRSKQIKEMVICHLTLLYPNKDGYENENQQTT